MAVVVQYTVMRTESVRVQNYRCIDDSGWVPVHDLTCFIGRNESGKTSFLEALENLNPAHGVGGYEPYEDYPRQDWREYDPDDGEPAVVVQAKFELEDDELDTLEDTYTEGLLEDNGVVVSRDYANEYHWEVEFDEAACLEYLGDEYGFDDDVTDALDDADSLSGLSDVDGGESAYAAVVDELGEDPLSELADAIGDELLEDWLPAFRYIGEYATINGTIDVQALLDRREANDLTPGDRAFLSLLTVAGLDIDDFSDVDDWRETTTELEAASADLSEEAMRYWSQSGDISIRIQHTTTDDDGDLLDLRVENHKHGVTVEFEQRSQGFRRFFSTFCQLSELRETNRDLVVMVDEPGQSLHARAKAEFLQFMKTEIAPAYTMLYTTHSPFMIDPETVHETKMVMSDPPGETNVFSDVTMADSATKFPLRNVFEADLMETLLVTPYTLVVENQADHIYLSVLSNVVEEEGSDGLDNRWTVVPITSYENIATFEGLFGEERLDIAAFLSRDPSDSRRSRRGERDALEDIPVTVTGTYTDTTDGGIEDIFSPSFYLDLVNRAYATEINESSQVSDRITPADVSGNGPIVERLEQFFKANNIGEGEFDRNRPALHLQENRDELTEEVDKASIRGFVKVFRDLNTTLTNFDSVEPQRTSLFDAFMPG